MTEVFLLGHLAGVPRATISAAAVAGGGAEVEQLIGAGEDFAIVLDHEQRVAQIAQLFERADQAAVVARMQADRRLVEHVEHAAQSAAHLAGQPNSLGFAAGERRSRPSDRYSSPTSTRN